MFRRHGGKVLGYACTAAAAVAGLAGEVSAEGDATGLCIDKLLCHRHVPPPRTPAVLVSCGSFNPPTIAHLRMFDLATSALAQRGYDVWGCYMSPVADTYGKKDLTPAAHRVEMCRLAAADTDNVMVDVWEAAQPNYTRTLQVLRHIAHSLQDLMHPQQQQAPHAQQQGHINSTRASSSRSYQQVEAATALPASHGHNSNAAHAAASSLSHAGTNRVDSSSDSSGDSSSSAAAAVAVPGAPQPRVMLLCGADLLASMNEPGVWQDPDIILKEHGVVCVCRAGSDVDQLLQQPGSVLHQFRDNITVVQEPVWNEISSTKVRQLLAAGQPVRYLVPDAVLKYIQQHGLFQTSPQHFQA